MNSALGLIETIGLVTAIEAADAAVKAAQIVLLGYENTKGGGKITVKFVGDVGAVQAGVAAGVAAASRIGQVYSYLVIPRPHSEIEELIHNLDRGRGKITPPTAQPVAPEPEPPVAPEMIAPEPVVETAVSAPKPPVEVAVMPPVARELVAAEPELLELQSPVAELVAEVEPAPRQCVAISKSGERCKRTAQAGSDYCYRHHGRDGNGGQASI